jgi:phosphatidylserine/phosphatidylglycerophosphate/cardiolipin synthase-like enzyme
MAPAHINRLDDAVGTGLERLVRAHHRRRLRRHGWARAYDPPADGSLWCVGDPPPRAGNAVEALVDGELALGRLAADIAAATESVHLAGWHFDPGFELVRDGPPLRALLAETAERVDVRLLAWSGAPLPLFSPSRATVREQREELVRGTRIRMALDSLERPMHCHHEKLAVIDGRIAYVGGLDLTGLAGDRLDRSGHPPRPGIGWHDAALRIEGPLVVDVAAHLALRWRAVTEERLEASNRLLLAGGTAAQFVRTVPNGVYDALPRGDFRILESYVRALRSAERLVYLESQFLWSSELVAILAEKLRRPPSDDFHVVVLLPARPNNGADDTRGQLGLLVAADREERFLACTLYQPHHGNQVYVHAKVGIVDDRWLSIGSANLNEHSLFNDTETCVITCDEQVVRATRLALWREHLERDEPTFETWVERAHDDRYDRLRLLPHISRRTRRFLGPVNGLLVDG